MISRKLKEALNSPEIKQRIEDMRNIRARYTENEWERAKNLVDKIVFPDKRMTESITNNTARSREVVHKIDEGYHKTTEYYIDEPSDLYIREYAYSFCDKCNKIISKRILLFNNVEGLVYIRDLMKNGNKTYAKFSNPVDVLNAPLMDFEGGDYR